MDVTNFRQKTLVEEYQKKPISHPFVVFPKLLQLLGNVKGKKILDLGCGAGDFAKLIGQKGGRIVAVDHSEKWIEICRKENKDEERVRCIVRDAANLRDISNASFDFIMMNMVFINVPQKHKIKKIFSEVSRVLKKNGEFIFTDLHPLCLMSKKSTTDSHEYPKDFSYFKDGKSYFSMVLMSDFSTMKFVDVHWTLETYTNFLSDVGMYIHKIFEPTPIAFAPKKVFKNYPVPEYIIFECKKLHK